MTTTNEKCAGCEANVYHTDCPNQYHQPPQEGAEGHPPKEEAVKMKPCPFCGSEINAEDCMATNGFERYVYCENCKTEGPIENRFKSAVELWNDRRKP